MRWRERLLSCLTVAALGGAGCVTGSTAGSVPKVDLSVAPLTDVNPSSPSYDQSIHPNDYQGGVSAWYFGHAT